MDGIFHFRAYDRFARVFRWCVGNGAIAPISKTLPSQSVVYIFGPRRRRTIVSYRHYYRFVQGTPCCQREGRTCEDSDGETVSIRYRGWIRMKKIARHNEWQFDYFSENYYRFEEDFYKYSALDTPLTFLADDILLTMVSSGKSYFRLNKEVAKDGRDHYFLFRIKMADPKVLNRTFVYLGTRVQLKSRN